MYSIFCTYFVCVCVCVCVFAYIKKYYIGVYINI